MKIIFLDIDGVLNNDKTWSGFGGTPPEGSPMQIPISPECMVRLNRLIEETEAKVVLSSSWRRHYKWQDLAVGLAVYGFKGEIIGATPDLPNDNVWLDAWRAEHGSEIYYEFIERGMEIWEWIVRNPGVKEFVILDDVCDMAHLRPFLVHTDDTVGLDDPDVERAKFLMMRSADIL